MIADIGRIMTGSARTGKRRHSQHIVNAGHTCDVDCLGVEHGLAPGDTGASGDLRIRPGAKQVKDRRVKRSTKWIEAETRWEGIVDANEEWLRSERNWTTV